MSEPNLADAALVLIGHGTSLDPDSAAPVYQHAAELRRRHIFGEVREGFWKQEPQVANVIAKLKHRRVFIAPFFISEGYFCERVIPEALGFKVEKGKDGKGLKGQKGWRVLEHEGQTLLYCEPVGTHPAMTDLVIERATQTIEQCPFPRAPRMESVSLFVAGHGTERDENSRESAERQVEIIRGRHVFASVVAIYMEEEPRISRFDEMTSSRNVVVVPFFVSEGLHVKQDIPVLLGAPERVVKDRIKNGQPPWRNPTEIRGKLVWYARAVGTEPRMAEIVLERVKEAAAERA